MQINSNHITIEPIAPTSLLAAIPTNYQNVNPNILINGDCRINQRGLFPVTTAVDGKYYVDHWKLAMGVVESDISLETTLQPSDMSGSYSIKTICTDVDATNPESGQLGQGQLVEDFALYAGKTVTFSVKMKSNHTEARLRIYDGVTFFDSTAHSGLGGWETLTLTATLSSSITQLLVQATIIGVASANVSIAVGDFSQFTGAKLELGSTATEFVADSEGESLRKCQRYYWQGDIKGAVGYFYGTVGAISMFCGTQSFPVTMYTGGTPSNTVETVPTYTNCSTPSLYSDEHSMTLRVTVTATGNYRAIDGIFSREAEL